MAAFNKLTYAEKNKDKSLEEKFKSESFDRDFVRFCFLNDIKGSKLAKLLSDYLESNDFKDDYQRIVDIEKKIIKNCGTELDDWSGGGHCGHEGH